MTKESPEPNAVERNCSSVAIEATDRGWFRFLRERASYFLKKGDSFPGCIPWFGSLLSALVLIYFLAAPPFMMAAWKQSGGWSLPAIYQPVMNVIESDFGGPYVWYCNTVWHADILLIGSLDGPPWYMMLLYAVLGIGLVVAILFPFVRRIRRRKK